MFKAFYASFADAVLRIAITNTDSKSFQLSFKTLTSRIFAACRICLRKIDWGSLDAFFNFLSTLEYFLLPHTTYYIDISLLGNTFFRKITFINRELIFGQGHSKRTILSADFYVRNNPGEGTTVTQVNDALHESYNNDL